MVRDFDFYTGLSRPFQPLRKSSMGNWSPLPLDTLHIHYEDFAYKPRRRSRMATQNIADAPARVFAEYVSIPIYYRSSSSRSMSSRRTSMFTTTDPPTTPTRTATGGGAGGAGLPDASPSPGRPGLLSRPSSTKSSSRYSFSRWRLSKAKLNNAQTATHESRLLSGPLVDIYVGPDRRHWSLHRNLLVHHSTYFESHFPDEAKKKGGRHELPDVDPKAFELLVKWLYQGRMEDVSAMPDDKKWDHAEACQNLYILCEFIGLPALKNLAIDQFRKGCNEAGLVPGPEESKPVYDRMPAGSPFRRLVSKIAARQIMDPESEKDASTYKMCFEGSPDFAIDVINAIREGTGGVLFDDPTEEPACNYHLHDNGQRCDDF
ncbi:hypothetical protein MMC25_007594 [Agyrium rufum]|nr:hypothetical protein [Agyrium rufum]